MSDEKDQIYLDHILECISLIQTYTQNGRASFWASAMMQDAVLRRLQTMSESTQRLSEVSKAQAPWVDWRALAGFRNVLVHDYLGGVDIERVWDAVEIHLPELEQAVRGLKALNNEIGSDSPR